MESLQWKAVGPMVGMPCQRNSYFLNQQNQLIKYIGFGSLKDLVAIGDPIKSLHWSPEFPSILNPSASMAARLSDLYCTAVLPISEGCLSISFSHAWYPANKRFASVELRWNSARPVKRITWKPSPWSSLYNFRLDGNAGAFAASTHSSKEVSLNSWDLKNQGEM